MDECATSKIISNRWTHQGFWRSVEGHRHSPGVWKWFCKGKTCCLFFLFFLALWCTWGLSILEVHIKGSHMPKHLAHCLIPVAVLFGNCNGKHNKVTKKRIIPILWYLKNYCLGNKLILIYTIIQEAAELLKDGIDLITEADAALTNLLSYPLHATLSRSVKTIYWIKFMDLWFLFYSLQLAHGWQCCHLGKLLWWVICCAGPASLIMY